jgi:MOSC domain-containing protein YiiM
MQVTSTNIAQPTTIVYRGKKVVTGIYKTPIQQPIYLGKSDVKDDTVTDRKYHGGEFKACYLFSENQYDYWKNLYPNLDWNWGMFGENLTVNGLDETKLVIGAIYKVGSALIQITEPREPCFKLGVKFGSQKVVKQFVNHGFPGTYVRVLEEGYVKTGDIFRLIEQGTNNLTTQQYYQLLFSKDKNQEHLTLAINNEAIRLKKRDKLRTLIK